MRDLKTPCCGAPLLALLGWEGPGYLQSEVVDSYMCGFPDCYNEWDPDGTAHPYNKYPNETDASDETVD